MTLLDKINKADFKKTLNALKYSYFTNGKYNMNIIGVRSSTEKCTNTFCDYLVLEYKDRNNKNVRNVYPITTNPGRYYMEHPLNISGCSILVPNQYKGAYTFGLHKKSYRALVQSKPVLVYRDNNKDNTFDFNKRTIVEGIFGINIHKAGNNSTLVDKWSAGCQVFAKSKDFYDFMSRVELQTKNGLGDKFTYTLIDEKDILY